MAKGHNFGSIRHERLLGSLGSSQSQSTGADLSDLAEEDIWLAMDNIVERGDTKYPIGGCHYQDKTINDSTIRAGRWHTTDDERVGGLSLAFEDHEKTRSRIIHQCSSPKAKKSSHGLHFAASAPINVPNWPKTLSFNSIESASDVGETSEGNAAYWVPPHEYSLSRKMASTSVFEGVGRTLKGSDLSRVRNEVLRQTGFLV
eukprot:TRINITY_DN5037_c0_g1_i1.p1 TRINITY_DN5037_c0_g1~~TRINITY_DN5037_c0_g1_i1.p1  ORF type:complete len:202 (-),score=5.98 TRINITY_DN5037_c0_g1_i1:266-871(-)